MLGVGSTVQASFVFGYGGATVNVDQSGDYILGNNFNVNSAIEVTQLWCFFPRRANSRFDFHWHLQIRRFEC